MTLIASGDAYVLARRVEQRIEDRATYHGGYGLSNPVSCPANYSTVCGSKADVNQLCCPQGDTCHGSTLGYCCPTCEYLMCLHRSPSQYGFECLQDTAAQDCNAYVTAFAGCSDPTANMYQSWAGYFCCAQGLTGVIPASGFPFCETADVSVAYSLLATMVSW